MHICDQCNEPVESSEEGTHTCKLKGDAVLAEEVPPVVRVFESGATRDSNHGKLEYSDFFSPEVLECRARFMHKNRFQKDGTIRSGGNWKKGINLDSYMQSLLRHVVDVWKEHLGVKTEEGIKTAICAAMFNLEGYLYELLKEEKGVGTTPLR